MTKISPAFLSAAPVQRIFDVLAPLGGAYVVGGAVRDTLFGQEPKDIDFATPATPEQVLSILDTHGIRSLPIGVEYGVVGAVIDDEVYEITTFRKDVACDGRRAVTVWGTSIEDDAVRRDLTINALYADRNGKVLDFVGGVQDIADRRIRFVGDAETRIREDRLRALRMFRFMARYGDPDPRVHADAVHAAAKFSQDLDILSRERVGAELTGLLKLKDPRAAIATMAATRMWEHILPESNSDAVIRLIAEEITCDAAPNPWLRLAAAGADLDLKTLLKVSGADQKIITAISQAARHPDPAVAAFLHGADAASASVVLRHARGLDVIGPVETRISVGTQAVFPLKSTDLPELSGKELGTALKAARETWLDTGLVMKAEALKADVLDKGLIAPDERMEF